MEKIENMLTVTAIAAVAVAAMYYLKADASDIVLATVSGLCGYLTKAKVS
jgi:TctA family transporter